MTKQPKPADHLGGGESKPTRKRGKRNWKREQRVASYWIARLRAILCGKAPAPAGHLDGLRSASPLRSAAGDATAAEKPPLQGKLFKPGFKYTRAAETAEPGYLAKRFAEINADLSALSPPANVSALKRKGEGK